MIAVITGDIIASRHLVNQEIWLAPLKTLLSTWGERPKTWNLDRGDFFQIEISNPEDALIKAFEIKSLIKKATPLNNHKKISTIDVRMAIGIGDKTYSGETISESNGQAFIYSGEKFDVLKKEGITIGIKTPWINLDEEINLYLKLSQTFIDSWSVSSAELVNLILKNGNTSQEEIGQKLSIKQNSVSGRWNRSHAEELLEVEKMFRKKVMTILK
jgi:hypothetical protein